MSHEPKAAAVLARDFLTMRCMLLELAGSLDRIARAEGAVSDDPRLTKIVQALEILADHQPDKAQRIQMLFSLPYQENWAEQFGVRIARR
jgi:hypothetical protein